MDAVVAPRRRSKAPRTTERQKQARRLNGAQSRGPITTAGKAVNRLNAVKHGLFAWVVPRREVPLIADRTEYDSLVEELTDDFRPSTRTGRILTESLAFDLMRLRFLVHVQAEMMEGSFSSQDEDVKRHRDQAARKLRGRTVEDMQTAINAMKQVRGALREGKSIRLAEPEIDLVADYVWQRLCVYGDLMGMAKRDISALRGIQASERDAENRRKRDNAITAREADISRWEECDGAEGPVAHGIRTERAVHSTLAGKRRMPRQYRQRWIQTFSEIIEGLSSDLMCVEKETRAVDSITRDKTLAFVKQAPDLELLTKYEGQIRRHIDKTLRQIRELEPLSSRRSASRS